VRKRVFVPERLGRQIAPQFEGVIERFDQCDDRG